MSLINTVYHAAFKRTSTFFLTVMMGTFVFEKIFDEGMDSMFETVNQGKLWMHIRSKYETEDGA